MRARTRLLLAAVLTACCGLALLIALVAGLMFDGGYRAAGEAMSPTIKMGDKVAIRTVGAAAIRRGDIVVFRAPAAALRPRAPVPDSVSSLLPELRYRPAPLRLMRVVAVGGDHIETRGDRFFVNGAPAHEPYLPTGTQNRTLAPTVLPEGTVWILGDNRLDSADSSAFGPVPVTNIEGRAELRYWPPSRFGRL